MYKTWETSRGKVEGQEETVSLRLRGKEVRERKAKALVSSQESVNIMEIEL